MGGLVPRIERAVLGGLPFTSSDFRDFRTHGPRMRIDDLSAPSGRFVARASASVATVDRRPGLRVFSPAANTAFASVFVVPSGGDQGSAEAPAPAAFVAHRAPPPMSTVQREDSAVSTAPAASAPSGQGSAGAHAAATTVAQRAPPSTSALQGEDSAVSTAPGASASSGKGYEEAPAVATIVAQRAPPPTSTFQEKVSAVFTDPAASSPSPPGNLAPLNTFPPSGRISTRTTRRAAAAAGSARPAVDYDSGPGEAPRP